MDINFLPHICLLWVSIYSYPIYNITLHEYKSFVETSLYLIILKSKIRILYFTRKLKEFNEDPKKKSNDTKDKKDTKDQKESETANMVTEEQSAFTTDILRPYKQITEY